MQSKQLRRSLAAFAIVAAQLPMTTHATPMAVCTSDGLCGSAQAMDAQHLAGVTGKFSLGGEVVGMNLQMASSWQAANGQNLNAKASLALALPGANDVAGPQASIQTQASVSEPISSSLPGTGLVSSGKGLNSIAGATQLVQVAGDNNGASNLTTIDVSPRAIALPGGANTPRAEAIAANGAKVTVDFANNGVALALNVPGAGSAQQRLNTLNANNILQSIQIAADRQQVMNQLQLQLQVRPQTAAVLAAEGFGQSLNMLRGR
ncbi:MAG: hypothetical protein GZ090_08305 [Oxalobacteraceae bacterium]|nr:hypothetical protein [Oxalobacteraceae bacterium]